jgi:type IV pilus modification protein PilV
MRLPRIANADQGFTLIEVMIALVVFSVGLLALAGLQVAAIQQNAFAKRLTAATALAEAALEQLKDTPYASVQSASATSVTSAGATFTRQVAVTAASPTPTTKTVRVTVAWTVGSKTYTVPLSTVISQP